MLHATETGSDASPVTHPLATFGAPHFRCLGVDGTTCFYQPREVADLIELSASAHTKNNLLMLAPLEWWEMEFPAKGGMALDAAVNACIRASKHKGKFARERLHGRGVHLDGGRVVAHLGDHLVVDGERCGLDLPDSDRVYVEGSRIAGALNVAPLSSVEARAIPDLLERFAWTQSGMGRLLAGWCVVAPLCGMLDWRSHIWINGPAGSGKSTILKYVVKQLMGRFAVLGQGTTTEAGLRQTLGLDARPVVFDEAEPQGDAGRTRMEGILELVRASSSDGPPILKGSAGGQSQLFRIQSMFAFASIDSAITRRADDSRTIKLGLAGPNPSASDDEKIIAEATYARLKADVQASLTEEFAERLFVRTLGAARAIAANAKVFSAAIAAKVGDPRLGDTMGALLAGWYSLSTTSSVDFETATRKLDEWGGWLGVAIEHNRAPADCHAALGHFLSKTIRLHSGAERTIEELAQYAGGKGDALSTEYAEVLYRHGMKVDLGDGLRLLVGNTHHFPHDRAFQGTPWNLKTVDGHPAVASSGKRTARFAGRAMKYRIIDVGGLLANKYPEPG